MKSSTRKWNGGEKTVWTVLAPPLVNGDMEETEDGYLVYWGLPPCIDDPADGKQCLRLDRKLSKHGLVHQLAPLKPGVKYRLTCRIKRIGKGWAGAHIVEYEVGRKPARTFRRSAVLNSTKVGEWETLETTFVSHPDPRSTGLYLYNGDRDLPAFFDGIRLEEVRNDR